MWAPNAPLSPPPRPLGRPRTRDLCEVVNALSYLLRGGCPWRLLPKNLQPRSTVQSYFCGWREDGLWQRINHDLLMRVHLAEGREASPSAGAIDSQQPAFAEATLPSSADPSSAAAALPAFAAEVAASAE